MKLKFTHLLAAAALLFATAMNVMSQIPEVSTEGNDIWYLIYSSPRNPDIPEAKWLTGAPDAGELSVGEFTGADNQRWKVVEYGLGFALINKAHGTYMNTDQTWNGDVPSSLLYASAARPSTQVKFVPSSLLTNGVVIVDVATEVSATNVINVATMTFSYYSAGSNIFKPISYPDINIHSSVKFMQERDFLRDALEEVRTYLNNISAGPNPGQYSVDNIESLTYTLEGFQSVYDDLSTPPDVYMSTANELRSIFEGFKGQIILPELSSGTTSYWYFIQGTRPANTYMTSTGPGGNVKSEPVIPADKQLWRLVSNPNGGFSLQNKVTEEYINTDLVSNSILPTQATSPQNGLRFIVSNQTTNKVSRFWVENEAGSTPALRLHAGGSGHQFQLMNWTGDAQDNSSWLFMSYAEALKTNLLMALTDARNAHDNAIEGTIFGQYTKEARADLMKLITGIEAIDLDTLSDEELLNNTELLRSALARFICNTDMATLESPTPAETDRWFRIVSAATADYARNKAISSRGRTIGEKLTFETIVEGDDEQLFRFELTEDMTAVRAIINKANNMYMAGNGAIAVDFPEINFTIEALDGFSFWLKPTGLAPIHAQQNGSHIVNWNAGAGSASAWRIVFVKDESNVVRLDEQRTVSVVSAQPAKGSAVITGTTDTSVTTDIKRVSVTAIPNTKVFFVCWTNAAGDTLSTFNPFIYEGTDEIQLTAHFEDGYYRPMTRFYTSVNPALQSEDRYLVSVWVNVGDQQQAIFDGVNSNPLPVDPGVAQNQVIAETIVDYTAVPMVVPFGTDSIEVVFKAQNRAESVENLQWTQQIVYVDWNQDFSFLGQNERTPRNIGSLIAPEGYSRKLAIPEGLPNDYYRMRVVYHEMFGGEDNWGTTIWTNHRIRNGIVYDFVIKYGNTTSVPSHEVQALSIRVVNSVITVEGDENFGLYSITGHRLNNKQNLTSGVYIVKSGTAVTKVMVK